MGVDPQDHRHVDGKNQIREKKRWPITKKRGHCGRGRDKLESNNRLQTPVLEDVAQRNDNVDSHA